MTIGNKNHQYKMLAVPSSTIGHETRTQSWNSCTTDDADAAAADLALDKLTELAIIATGPQSPLLQHLSQESNEYADVTSFNNSIHSYAKPPPTTLDSWSAMQSLKSRMSDNEDQNNISSETSQLLSSMEALDKTELLTSWDTTDAALALSHMARNHSLLSEERKQGSSSAPTTPVKKRHKSTSAKMTGICKRPMNAFMLFAKRFRVEYTQLHPGKDNRAISIILGDQWKQLCKDERAAYTQEAKQMADEYKKTNPDCWKRKRHHSTST